MKAEKFVITIFRTSDPDGREGTYQTYELPHQEGTVLQVLEQIYKSHDPTLAFRCGCGGSGPARCGACAIEVDGVPVLACAKPAEKEMELRPHHKFKVLRDLVVDFETNRGKR